MLEPHVHLAYAPRGAGVLCAAFWVASGSDCCGWFTGAQGYEHPASFFLLEDYYSSSATVCYRSLDDDVRGKWLKVPADDKSLAAELDEPPLAEAMCHDMEQMQDAFTREWLFYRHALDAEAEAAVLRARELPVMALNIRPKKLNKLQTGAPVWTFTSPGADLNVIAFLARYWTLDYVPE
jgi:hypothetical protein